MEATSIKLQATEIAAVKYNDRLGKYYNFTETKLSTDVSQAYIYSDSVFVKFQDIPASARCKKPVSANFYFFTSGVTSDFVPTVYGPSGGELPINLSDATYATNGQSSYRATYSIGERFTNGWANTDYITEKNRIDTILLYGLRCDLSFRNTIGQAVSGSADLTGMTTNRPYLQMEMDNATTTISLVPGSGYVDDKITTVFKWSIDTDAVGGADAFTPATGSTLEWRNGAAGAVNAVVITAGSESVSVPANTFPADSTELQCRLNLKFDHAETITTAWFLFSTVDSVPKAEPIAPVSTYLDGNKDAIFRWSHYNESGTKQTKSELQYSMNNGSTWITFAMVTGDRETVTVSAGTLPAGVIMWRVRTYNSDNVQSAWSVAVSVVVQASPPVPVITAVTQTPRPVLRWKTTGQQAYHVRVGSYDSGPIYGAETELKIPSYLPDGVITAYVRVQNALGMWSDWGSVNFAVKNNATGTIKLHTDIKSESAVLLWGGDSFVRYYVYRDDVPVAVVQGITYTDELAVGMHEYYVMGVTNTDGYIISNRVKHNTIVKNAKIAAIEFPHDWVLLQCKRGEPPLHTTNKQANVSYNYYDGRTLPIATVAEYQTVTDDFSFTVRSDERRSIERMLGKLVIYKDCYGERVIGILNALAVAVQRRSDVEFTIHRVDWNEAIGYDTQ